MLQCALLLMDLEKQAAHKGLQACLVTAVSTSLSSALLRLKEKQNPTPTQMSMMTLKHFCHSDPPIEFDVLLSTSCQFKTTAIRRVYHYQLQYT